MVRLRPDFAQILQTRAMETPEERAFVFLDRRNEIADERSFRELDLGARRVGAALTARGVCGKPVLLVFPSGLEFVEALFGCFYAGCTAVPTPYLMARRAGDRITAICRDSRPAALLTLSRMERDAEVRGVVSDAVTDTAIICTDRLDPAPASWTAARVHPGDVALLQYTSGSTSAPKGVVLSHGNLVANSAMICDAMGHDSSLRVAGWLPLFHDMGLVGHVLQPVYVGVLSVLMSPLAFMQRPVRWLKAISDWRATTSGGPAYAFELCVTSVSSEQARALDLSSWRVAYCGSEPIRVDVLKKFAERFAVSGFRSGAIYPCYGLAEATLMVTGSRPGAGMRAIPRGADAASGPPDRQTRQMAGCGWPCQGESLAIVEPDSGRPVAAGEIGEIWVKGPNVGQGYWGRPQETKEIFDASTASGETGFLRTGDLGLVRNGEVYVTGRMKDMIIVRGLNHAPEDIEATVAASHHAFAGLPGAACGIDIRGEEQVVVIQEFKSRASQGGVAAQATAAAFERVTADHQLGLYDLVLVRPGAIPRTSSGKVRRRRCREMYEAGEFARLNAPADLRFLGINLKPAVE